MSRSRRRQCAWVGLAAALSFTAAVVSAARQAPASAATDATGPRLLTALAGHTAEFRRSLAHTPDREWIVGRARGHNIDYFVGRFVDAVRRLRADAARGPVLAAQVDHVLRLGVNIDSYMERHRGPDQASRDWATVRHDLEALARAFDVPWNQAMPRVTSASRPGLQPVAWGVS